MHVCIEYLGYGEGVSKVNNSIHVGIRKRDKILVVMTTATVKKCSLVTLVGQAPKLLLALVPEALSRFPFL